MQQRKGAAVLFGERRQEPALTGVGDRTRALGQLRKVAVEWLGFYVYGEGGKTAGQSTKHRKPFTFSSVVHFTNMVASSL